MKQYYSFFAFGFAISQSINGWPWIAPNKSLASTLAVGYLEADEKFSDGTKLAGYKKGERIPIFVDGPGRMRSFKTTMKMEYTVLADWAVYASSHWASILWDRAETDRRQGFSDSRLGFKYQVPFWIPATAFFDWRLPTGETVNQDIEISLGQGAHAFSTGLSFGGKWKDFIYHSSQGIQYPFARKIGGGTFTKGPAWKGTFGTHYSLGKHGLFLSGEGMWAGKSHQKIGSFKARLPGEAYFNLRLGAGFKLGDFKWSPSLTYPLAGVEYPTGIRYQLAISHAFRFQNKEFK